MGTRGHMGILVTATEGGSRLLPLEFTLIDGAWCAVVPLGMANEVMPGDGLPADVIFLEDAPARVQGVLSCGPLRTENHLLVKLLPMEEPPVGQAPGDLPRAA